MPWVLKILRDFCGCYKKEVPTEAERKVKEMDGCKGSQRPALPRKHDARPTLVLDLDNTLVHSTFEMPEIYDFCVEVPKSKGMSIYVKVRPHTAEFIDEVGAMYELVIFTAAKREYAGKVVEMIDANKNISHTLYRESCTLTNGRYVKDLCKLGRPLNKVIMVDDSPHSYEFQPRNGIHIPPYTGATNDDSLLKVMKYLKELSKDDLVGSMDQVPFRDGLMTGLKHCD
ncbi:Dullard-like phosphatase domain-containing protein [Encephalitozoon hellem ATCC 50504]|uniref:Carboxy-terminal domain RNA polymerase II polypeptide A small phosphatase 1 n=1 Tax=Encephalitozoon hellem TaxID=27973 RepID=A0A9Q9CE56_ENCHE|nr:Dullard-like phosphatase domain-containing protein [Encephalitozoon hellem ATCC 50504]AFM99221.1 Dullard-like phosphatase domain-containing protein [Encephalitozoon hellem ATCC 50504]UTX44208.1 carboxy-terminal domain RNA polymerase II polypeptide A small phosphatase 1 [Encephalitozoon hellem]|eukprot:XP_003888202.1 Dullard-like phosphatase domain-containing protein [Encephalitozoon hellem ATCC 50504]